MTSVLLLVILGLVILIFTQRYIEKNSQWSEKDYYVHLKTKVLNNDDGLPIIWIYVPHNYNARNWLSFGSRSSYDTNEPYMNLTIKSIYITSINITLSPPNKSTNVQKYSATNKSNLF